MLKITIYKRNRDEVFYIVFDENDQKIFTSYDFASKRACLNGIEQARKYGSQVEFYAKRISFDAKYIFYLTGIVGLVFGISEFWNEEATRDKYIQKMLEGIKNAELADEVQIF